MRSGAEVRLVGDFHVEAARHNAEEPGTRGGGLCPCRFAWAWNVAEDGQWLGREMLQPLPGGALAGAAVVGVGQAFRAVNPDCRLIGMEPAASCRSVCGETGKHLSTGMADHFVARIIERHRGEIDAVVAVESDEAVAEMRRIAPQQGGFGGPSSGGHRLAARGLREQYPELRDVITLSCDRGEQDRAEHIRLHAPNA